MAAGADIRGAQVRMGTQKPGVVSGMTTVDDVTRIMELTRAVEWRDQKLDEQAGELERLRELLDEARANASKQETFGDTRQRPGPPR
jgi:hypothetical protein